MKLFSKPEQLNKPVQLAQILLKNDSNNANDELDTRLHFEFKSEFGRTEPSDDSWQKIHARIMEREQQQAAQIFQPSAQRVPIRAWSGWNDLMPRLSQGFAAVLLFLFLHNAYSPNMAGPIDTSITPTVQLQAPPTVVSSSGISPQESRALRVAQDAMTVTAPTTQAKPSVTQAPSPLAERTNEVRALKTEAVIVSAPTRAQSIRPQVVARVVDDDLVSASAEQKFNKNQPELNKPE